MSKLPAPEFIDTLSEKELNRVALLCKEIAMQLVVRMLADMQQEKEYELRKQHSRTDIGRTEQESRNVHAQKAI